MKSFFERLCELSEFFFASFVNTNVRTKPRQQKTYSSAVYKREIRLCGNGRIYTWHFVNGTRARPLTSPHDRPLRFLLLLPLRVEICRCERKLWNSNQKQNLCVIAFVQWWTTIVRVLTDIQTVDKCRTQQQHQQCGQHEQHRPTVHRRSHRAHTTSNPDL